MSANTSNDVAKEQKLIQDHKRERDQKYKWAHGEATLAPGRPSRRPAKFRRLSLTRAPKPDLEIHPDKGASVGAKINRKVNTPFDSLENPIFISDSSAEEDIKEASAAPEPDAGISYSFDAPRGPHQGSQILSMALAKAVEKYEIQATERLVRDEYEIIRKEKDDHHDGYAADEDDFELI